MEKNGIYKHNCLSVASHSFSLFAERKDHAVVSNSISMRDAPFFFFSARSTLGSALVLATDAQRADRSCSGTNTKAFVGCTHRGPLTRKRGSNEQRDDGTILRSWRQRTWMMRIPNESHPTPPLLPLSPASLARVHSGSSVQNFHTNTVGPSRGCSKQCRNSETPHKNAHFSR